MDSTIVGKKWWQSKTVWYNILSKSLMIVALATHLVPPAYLPYLAMADGIINVVLRFITGTPIGASNVSVSFKA